MSTLLVICSLPILTAAASYENSSPDAALEWWPVIWSAIYLSVAVLLLLLVVLTCAKRRERIDSKGLLGTDLVERGVLLGEQPAGPCEWLSRRWPWSPVPPRSPQLGYLRMGLARSTQPLLCYQLLEKRHVHLVRGALCVLRMELKELQELAEKESGDSTDMPQRMSYLSQHGSMSGRPVGQYGSVSGKPIAQLGTVKPVESSGQRVSWNQDETSATEFLEGRAVGEPLPEESHKDPVIIRGDSTQIHNNIIHSNIAANLQIMEEQGLLSETTNPSNTADTEGMNDNQPPSPMAEETMENTDQSTSFKNVVKARSYNDIIRKSDNKHKPTIYLEGTETKRDLTSLHKVKSETDLTQTSDSDVLVEISGSSEDFHSYLTAQSVSRELESKNREKTENTALDKQFKIFGNISTQTDNSVSLPSQEKIRPAITNTARSSSIYVSVLDKNAPKLHTLHTEETEESHMSKPVSKVYVSDVDDISRRVSSCFLHDVMPFSQQECLQLNKHNNFKSNISFYYEKSNSVQHPQHWKQTEYNIAPASVITTNDTFFCSSKIATKGQNTKSIGNDVTAEDTQGLKTTWDLLHNFPCHTDMVQTLRMDARSKFNPISKSLGKYKQHDELSIPPSYKGDEVLAAQQQETYNMDGIITDSSHEWSWADKHKTTVRHKPPSYRPDCLLVSDSETTTELQHCPLATMNNTDGHHKVLQWRITISPHIDSHKNEHTMVPDQGLKQYK